MKGTLKSFKKVLRESFEKKLEDLDRERRTAKGEYENEDEMAGVSYGDRYGEAVELEDTDRVRRAQPGEYAGETTFDEVGSLDLPSRPGAKPPAGGDTFKGLGATGASQLSKGTAATAAKSDPNLVVQTVVDTVMQQLSSANPSTRATALTKLKQALGPGGGKMPSMESLTSELDDPPGDPEKKKQRGKSHAAPSETGVGITGGASTGVFGEDGENGENDEDDECTQMSGYDPLSDDDPKDRVREKAPPGKEKMVKALKDEPDVDNPWAVAWAAHHKAKDRREQ